MIPGNVCRYFKVEQKNTFDQRNLYLIEHSVEKEDKQKELYTFLMRNKSEMR